MSDGLDSVQIFPPVPFSMLVVGCSMAGKSTWILKVLKHWSEMFPNDEIRKIVLVHKFGTQPIYAEMQDYFKNKLLLTTVFSEELFENEKCGSPKDGVLICILDDILHEISSSPLLTQLVVGGTHHLRIVTIIVGHNLYANRHVNWITVSRNVTCLALFQSPRDKSTFNTLNKQLYANSRGVNYVAKAFELARKDQLKYNSNKCGYLFVDCSVQCDPRYRLRTGVGAEQKFIYVTPPE